MSEACRSLRRFVGRGLPRFAGQTLPGFSGAALTFIVFLSVVSCAPAPQPPVAAQARSAPEAGARPASDPASAGRAAPGTRASSRDALVGAWRLVSIQIEGPDGITADPFYNSGATGLLVYDASGWMSVQIVNHPRSTVEVPAVRPSRNVHGPEVEAKAAVLDTYYAYYGTWTYNVATSAVTHHIDSSLFSSESGKSYSQTAVVDGDTLVFTSQQKAAGVPVVQKKLWKRLSREDSAISPQ